MQGPELSIDSSRVRFASAPFAARLLPSLADLLFASLLIWLFVAGSSGWDSLLADGDAGWHIRTGEYILDNGRVPRQDLFSFSKPDAQWFAWEWLSDVIFALTWRWAAMKGLVLLAGTVIICAYMLLFRNMLRRGANGMAALVVLLLSVGCSSIHFLARPHIFTLLLLPVVLGLLDQDRERRSWQVWLIVPLTALWTNLHGGFMAGVACVGLVAVASVLERRWSDARRLAALTIGCAAASLANPYGYQLHVHILAYMRSDWIRSVVDEFQSPRFRDESMLQYEALLIAGLVCLPALWRRKNWADALWIAAWAHLSLGAVRHVPIYVMVAAPVIARELTALWSSAAERQGRKSAVALLLAMASDVTAGFRRVTPWMAAPVVLLALPWMPVKWPADFPAAKFPVEMVNRHSDLLLSARVFTQDQWADYLIYRFYPHLRVFHDGRSDFFGPDLGKDYVMLMNAGYDSEKLLERHGFGVALLPVAWPLSTLLKYHAGWELVADDKQSILFRKRDLEAARLASTKSVPLPPVIAKKISRRLMNPLHAAERQIGDP